jgi:hypothetical protein
MCRHRPCGDRALGHAMADKDYAGTPLWKKLGLREGSRVLLVHPPAGFAQKIAPLPAGVTLLTRASKSLDVVVLFVTRRRELERRFPPLAQAIAPAGRLWVAWPKKGADPSTDIAFADAQGIGLDAGLVDNKSAAVTEAFQGLQFVYRSKDRPAPVP